MDFMNLAKGSFHDFIGNDRSCKTLYDKIKVENTAHPSGKPAYIILIPLNPTFI